MSKSLANGESAEPEAKISATEAAATTPPADAAKASESMAAELAVKTRELAELNDKYLRALAETENVRKRARQQSEETVRLQRENLLRDILPIVDNLERALHAAQGGADSGSIVAGVTMVLRSLLDFLKGHGVSQVIVLGEPFDPSRHEAVDQIESAEYPPNTVVNEFHRGYLIGDRILRPARVSVAKGATSAAAADGNDKSST